MGTSRYVYNRAVDLIRQQDHLYVDKIKLTEILITKKSRKGELNKQVPAWTFETPKDIRKGAIRDLSKAYKAAFTNLKEGNIKRFYMKKKVGLQSVEIPDSAVRAHKNGVEIFPSYGLGKN